MEFGHASLIEREIVAFARDYHPQSIRTDPAWLVTGPFGGLLASGRHTIAACMRLHVDHSISQVAGLASPGPYVHVLTRALAGNLAARVFSPRVPRSDRPSVPAGRRHPGCGGPTT